MQPQASKQAPEQLEDLEEITSLPDPAQAIEAEGDDFLDDAPIWQRTRARKPLHDVTLEELEALLQDENISADAEDHDAYEEFLKVCQLKPVQLYTY